PPARLRGHDDRPDLFLPGEGQPVRRDAPADDQLGARPQHRRELLPGVDRGPDRAAAADHPAVPRLPAERPAERGRAADRTAPPVAPAPPGGGFCRLPSPGQIWPNDWPGLLLDTTGRPNGLNTISVKLFAAQNTTTEIGSASDPGRSAKVMIDNTVPVANILQ